MNEVLCLVQNYVSSVLKNNIIGVGATFFMTEEIVVTKTLLFDFS